MIITCVDLFLQIAVLFYQCAYTNILASLVGNTPQQSTSHRNSRFCVALSGRDRDRDRAQRLMLNERTKFFHLFGFLGNIPTHI